MWPFQSKVNPTCLCGGQIVYNGWCYSCALKHIYGDNFLQSPPPNPAAPEPELVAVDTEIIAWRAWALTEDDWLKPVLMSPQHNTMIWDGPVARAHKVPARNTSDGLYARKERNALADYLSYPVIGTVALSGIVVEGDTGYRAEVATVRSLIVRREALAGRYCLLEACGYLAERYEVEPSVEEWSATPYGVTSFSGLQGIGGCQGLGGFNQQSLIEQQYQNHVNQAMHNGYLAATTGRI